MIEFSDGTTAETTGDLRIEEGSNGWQVLGDGIIFPAVDREEAEFPLEAILSQGIYVAMKMFKSEGFRERVRAELASRGAGSTMSTTRKRARGDCRGDMG